jgi:hypothetical protein
LIAYDEAFAFFPINFDLADHLLSYIAFLAISFDDVVYAIAIGVIQTKEVEERVVVAI